MKAAFPLAGRRRRPVLDGARRRAVPPLARDGVHARRSSSTSSCGRAPTCSRSTVHKRRARYTIGGCTAELTDVRTDGGRRARSRSSRRTRTLVLAAVRELGLGRAPNIELPARAQGARRVRRAAVRGHRRRHELGQVPPRRAGPDGAWRTVVDRAEVTRLGEGLDETGRLGAGADGADGRGDRRHGRRGDGATAPLAIAAVGTAGLRIAPNSAEFVDAVRGALRRRDRGHPRRGGGPARLPRGEVAGSGSPTGSLVVFDTGGGSSQFTFGHGDRVDERFSVDVGAVRLHGAVRPRRRRLRGRARRGARRDRRRPRAPRRPADAGRARRRWAAPSPTSPR